MVGKGMDIIRATPKEDVLIIGNAMEKTLKVITLDMTRTIDTTGLPSKGPAGAPVEVVVFSDFQCPACADLAMLLDQVMIAYPETVKVVFMNYPLRSHPYSRLAAAAALVAGMQGRFWEFHDLLFDNYDKISPQKITEIVRELKLDEERLKRDINTPEVADALNHDASEAYRLDVSGTPTVFVNGRILRDHSMKSFQAAIEKEAGSAAEK